MKVTIDIDDKVWAALADFADARNVRVADLVRREVHAGLRRLIGSRMPHQRRVIRTPNGENPYEGRRVIDDYAARKRIEGMFMLNVPVMEIAARMGYGRNGTLIAATLWDMGHDTRRRPRSREWARNKDQESS